MIFFNFFFVKLEIQLMQTGERWLKLNLFLGISIRYLLDGESCRI